MTALIYGGVSPREKSQEVRLKDGRVGPAMECKASPSLTEELTKLKSRGLGFITGPAHSRPFSVCSLSFKMRRAVPVSQSHLEDLWGEGRKSHLVHTREEGWGGRSLTHLEHGESVFYARICFKHRAHKLPLMVELHSSKKGEKD